MPEREPAESPRPVSPEGVGDEEISMLRLLSSGATDEDTAAKLGWSRRTLERRVRAVMDTVAARSRLHLGYILGRAGWLEEPR